ncbi:MAG TPA: FAD-dependent monooxygenase [Candidatus Dormibacteraeota bacterium]
MKYAVLGGGPAGLYFALLAKKADPEVEVRVVERNPPDATFGWGVVFSEETLGALRDADYETYVQIGESFARWNAIDIFYRDTLVRSRGHSFTGISRKVLLGILQRRCLALGVHIDFGREIHDLAEMGDADLVVGADGLNGLTRRSQEATFRPHLMVHPTKYVWFGSDMALDAFTFIFRRNAHGLFQVHAYPFDAHTSTFIVECPEEAWRNAGLDRATEADSIAYCEQLFAPELRGHRLLSNRSLWLNFSTLRSESWHQGNVVLLGDAAHTAHFSIGSGTKLAMEDSIALMDALRRHPDLKSALTDYEMERQPVVERFQEAALESATYFEHVARYEGFQPTQFAFNLLTRSRRITYVNLTQRDPMLVRSVDAHFAAVAGGVPDGPLRISPPPMFAGFTVGGLRLSNRTAGLVTGAGLYLSEFTAVSHDGRVTPETSGIDSDEGIGAIRSAVARVHSEPGARFALQLGHAGRRGAMRPRAQGVDRPLRWGGWPVISASPIPYTQRSRTPRAMTEDDMVRVVAAFDAAAAAASRALVDVLELNFAQGYLVASFISPLTNARADEYGGALECRLRFPLAVLDAVRARWSGPLMVRITAEDWAPGGSTLDDAVAVARILKAHGCDVVHPVLGQTVSENRPDYSRLFGVPSSDRIRNEAGIPTLASGNITTTDEVNTVLAAGRADLCVLEAR